LAKRFFSQNGITVEERNVEKQEFMDELVSRFHSLTLPTIVMDDEIILGFGINKKRIMHKLNIGEEVI
jgi:glutaredoxin